MLGIEKIVNQLINDESLKTKVYKCPAGKLTIGIGRNLEDTGITKEEAKYLCENDIKRCYIELIDNISCFELLNDSRKRVLINMCFNLGINGLLKFKNMISALAISDYKKASEEMIDSRWAKQVGRRANKLSKIMLIGKD